MPNIAITNGVYTNADTLLGKLAHDCGCRIVTDSDLVEKTSSAHALSKDLILKVLRSKPIAFNKFSNEREICISALKVSLSGYLIKGNSIFTGFISHLIPSQVTHMLRVLITDSLKNRILRGIVHGAVPESIARKNIETNDSFAEQWTRSIKGKSPWNPDLYDLAFSLEHLDRETIPELICKKIALDPFSTKDPAGQETMDFKILAEVETALSKLSQGLVVEAHRGNVTVTLDKKVMNLSKVQQRIIHQAGAVPGVTCVKTKIGPNYYKRKSIRDFDFST